MRSYVTVYVIIRLIGVKKMRNEVALFHTEITEVDGKGRNTLKVIATSEYFVREKSVSSKETVDAKQKGHNAELVICVSLYDWNKETLIMYDGTYYRAYRTYKSYDTKEVELYCGVSNYVAK